MSKLENVTLRIHPDVHRQMKLLAVRKGITLTEAYSQAGRLYIKHLEDQHTAKKAS